MSKQSDELAGPSEEFATQARIDDKTLDDRRTLLKKLGRLGLYTAPALIMTFESPKAAIPFSQTA